MMDLREYLNEIASKAIEAFEIINSSRLAHTNDDVLQKQISKIRFSICNVLIAARSLHPGKIDPLLVELIENLMTGLDEWSKAYPLRNHNMWEAMSAISLFMQHWSGS